MTDARTKTTAASVEPQTEDLLELVALKERYPVDYLFYGSRPHYRDPSFPPGHAKNPIPPVPLHESDWVVKLHRKLGLPPPR